MGRHADHAHRTHGQQGQGQGVLAAVDLEALGSLSGQAGRLGHVARRVLDGDDVVDLGQLEDGRRVDLASRTGRDVVEHHR